MLTLSLHGSMFAIFVWLLVGGLGVPLPEDVALLAAGALVYHGAVPLPIALTVVLTGVLAGDVSLFLLARHLGARVYERPLLRRLLTPERRARIEAAYERRGGRLIFIARHVAGLRTATFVLAGIHRMRLRTFVGWDALAACISVPLMVGLGFLGALHIDQVRADIAKVELGVLAVAIVALLGSLAVRSYLRPRGTP